MKMINAPIAALAAIMLLLAGCGKPNDPESVVPDDTSGGYMVVARFATPAYAQDVIRRDSLLYIAQGEGGLMILDVKDPALPKVVSITTDEVRGYSTKIMLKDSVAYLAAGTFGITVLNIANPAAPFVTVANLGMKPARNIYIMGNYMFTATSEQGVTIADVSYPLEPDIRGGISTSGYAYGVTASADSNHLFVACGEMGLSIFNISDMQGGFGTYPLTGWCDTPGYAESVIVDDSRSLAYLACGIGGLQIVDYADTANIRIVGSFKPGGYAKELCRSGNRIFLTAEKSGLQIVDITDITEPVVAGQIHTEYALGVDVDDDYAYVADEIEGIVIVSTHPIKPDNVLK